MQIVFVIFVLAFIANGTLSMNLRHKRQSEDGEDIGDGWNRPAQRPLSQNQDQWEFPAQGQQFPAQWQPFPGHWYNQQQATSTTASSVRTTTLSLMLRECIRLCPKTAEYNPVCGSDNQTYFSPGKLTCAQYCGIAVLQVSPSPCPTTNTEAAPTRLRYQL